MSEELKTKNKKKGRINKIQSVYTRCLLTRKVILEITNIGKNLKETIEENIKNTIEGKCVVEGYIKQNSCKIVTYSSGTIYRGNLISFEVVFECDICFPVEGMLVSCVAKNITKAGIRAESADEVPSPIIVFIAKDHHYSSSYFNEIQEGDKINVRVIGQRFELNDKYISIIGELVKDKDKEKEKDKNFQQQKTITKKKPRIIIEEE